MISRPLFVHLFVHRMVNGQVPKDVLYSELLNGTRTVADHIVLSPLQRHLQVRHENGRSLQKNYEKGEDRYLSAADLIEIATPESDFLESHRLIMSPN